MLTSHEACDVVEVDLEKLSESRASSFLLLIALQCRPQTEIPQD